MKEGENVIKFVASQVFRQRMFFINIEEIRIRLHIYSFRQVFILECQSFIQQPTFMIKLFSNEYGTSYVSLLLEYSAFI